MENDLKYSKWNITETTNWIQLKFWTWLNKPINNIWRRHEKSIVLFGLTSFTFKTFTTLKRKPCIAADVKEESICGFSSEVLRFKATLRWCFTLLIWQLIAYKITSRYFNGNPHYASEMIWAKGIFHTKSQGKNLGDLNRRRRYFTDDAVFSLVSLTTA